MTLRFLDLTALLRFLAVELNAKTRNHHANGHDQIWYQQLSLMAARARQRRQLLNLSDERLDDIGITRAQMLEEASKPFWKA
jgi:uncharacterized protein YjiS (DUF1127 family)